MFNNEHIRSEHPKAVPFIVVMGVSGSGKTTVGQLLAKRLNVPFYDADDFHPPENIAKMSAGFPLNDEDRMPWLDRLHALIRQHIDDASMAVVTCSALKRSYRERLRGSLDAVQFVYLDGDFDVIWQRMQAREGHYMKAGMLHSQFDTLEPPSESEAIRVSIALPPEQIVKGVLNRLVWVSAAKKR